MMRALFSGVSGLENHQTRMDVISDNIANVNTIGYKASRAEFSDILSQTIQAASSGNGSTGGTDAKQIGLGVGVSSIDTIFTDGSTESTGVPTDLAISGSGFFAVTDGSNQYYTRNGEFKFDSSGNLVASNGYKVEGWMADSSGNINTSGGISGITIPVGKTMAAKPSTKITYASSSNLEAGSAIGTSTTSSTTVYDSISGQHDITQTFTKIGSNKWLMVTSSGSSNDVLSGGTVQEVSFDSSGNLVSTSPQDVAALATPTAAINFSGANLELNTTSGSTTTTGLTLFDASGKPNVYTMTFTSTGANTWSTTITNPSTSTSVAGPTVTFNTGTNQYSFSSGSVTPSGFASAISFTASGTSSTTTSSANVVATTDATYNTNNATPVTITSATGAFTPVSLDTSVSDLKQYNYSTTSATASSALTTSTDGYAAGTLKSQSIDSTGTIIGSFSNGQTLKLGQVAMANFNNPGGLTKSGDSLYTVSNNSGTPQVGAAGTSGFGNLASGELEMSNVDLSEEFSNMIITQRGFQANSKVITTVDDMLNTLANLKQG